MSLSLLIIEDDEAMRLTLEDYFTQKGYTVYAVAEGTPGLAVVKNNNVDVALLDINLPDGSGLDFLPRMRAEDEQLVVVVMTAYPDVANAVQAMKDGAFDYIIKPFDLDDMDITLDRALEHCALRSRVEQLEAEQATRPALRALLGDSAPMAELRDMLAKVAQSPRSTVLVLGESGTGKELVVNALHAESDRRKGPLITINCSAIPESLVESEIFGYEKGAFTGATDSKRGMLELAHRGTLFFDELGDLAVALQPKLLRVMEERVFRRVGGVRDLAVDVRFVAATNHNLEEMVHAGTFREDLYFRFKVMEMRVPPLRERRGDVPLLVEHFIARLNRELGKTITGTDEAFVDLSSRYPWPGNVRELLNVIERQMILSQTDVLRGEDLPPDLKEACLEAPLGSACADDLEEVERLHILRVLAQNQGNKSRTARELKIARSTLQEKLKRYRIG